MKKSISIENNLRLENTDFIFSAVLSGQFDLIQSYGELRTEDGAEYYIHHYELSDDRDRCANAGEPNDPYRDELRLRSSIYTTLNTIMLLKGSCVIARVSELEETQYVLSLKRKFESERRYKHIELLKSRNRKVLALYDSNEKMLEDIWGELNVNKPIIVENLTKKPFSEYISKEDLENELSISEDDLVQSITVGGRSADAVFRILGQRFEINCVKGRECTSEDNYSFDLKVLTSEKLVRAILNSEYEPYPVKGKRGSALIALASGARPELSGEIMPFLESSVQTDYMSSVNGQEFYDYDLGLTVVPNPENLTLGYESPSIMANAALVASRLDDDSAITFYEKYKNNIEFILALNARLEKRNLQTYEGALLLTQRIEGMQLAK